MKLNASERIVLLFLIIIIAIVILRCAWMSDDAYISLRTVDNFVSGHGLTWNIAERVQSFTHPLWVLLISAFYVFTNEAYFTVVFLSVVLSLLAVWLVVFRLAVGFWEAILGLLILAGSKAFIDYTTSGLENPLSYVLFAVYLLIYLKHEDSTGRLFRLSLLFSLIALNRLDLALLAAPVLVHALLNAPKVHRWRTVARGLVPLALWEVFSLIYYGFPFPNTFYAKLYAGVATGDLLRQGLVYFLESFNQDPLTLAALLLAVAVVAYVRPARSLPVAIGLVLYSLYIVRIGGDFMVGRFFTVPLLCAVIVLTQWRLPAAGLPKAALIVGVLLLGLINPRSPFLSGRNYSEKIVSRFDDGTNGVEDERAFYYSETGLLFADRLRTPQMVGWIRSGIAHRKSGEASIIGASGHCGYAAGPDVHLIDVFALNDPLLARIPCWDKQGWRIGHFDRIVPAGYEESCALDANAIRDSSLAAYYDVLRDITRGPVWRWSRLQKIAGMNLGMYDYLLDQYENRPLDSVPMADYSEPVEIGSHWLGAGNIVLGPNGVGFQADSLLYAEALEISVDNNDRYRLSLFHGEDVVDVIELPVRRIFRGGMRIDTAHVNVKATTSGYDRVVVRGLRGDGRYSVGHIVPLEE